MNNNSGVIFKENLGGQLSIRDLENVIRQSLAEVKRAQSVLVLHNDYSRHDFTELIFPILYRVLAEQGLQRIDTLNAGGTHRAMTAAEIKAKLGISGASFSKIGELANHVFDNSLELVTVGEIPAEFIAERTGGTLKEPLSVNVNRRLTADYDLVLALTGTVPHEAIGFSGGLKIFFPGVAGPEVIGLLHWASVLIGIPEIIGKLNTPASEVVALGAKFCFDHIKAPQIISFNMLYSEQEGQVIPKGLYSASGYQGFREAHALAARGSATIHLVYLDHPLERVVQQIPLMYDEVWTAGKGSYKLQRPGVMAPGGEIILFAPHIHCFHSNVSMDQAIRSIGYHCRDYVVDFMRQHPEFDRNVAAHVINVRGPGNLSEHQEQCLFKVTLASGISPKDCQAVGLGYLDPATLNAKDFTADDKLWIEEGGKWLYNRKQFEAAQNSL